MHVLESCRNALQDLAANARRVGRLLEAPEAGELAVAEQARILLALGRVAERVERLADRLERRLGRPLQSELPGNAPAAKPG